MQVYVKYYQKCVKFAYNYFTNSSASEGLRPQALYGGSAPGPRWGTSVPKTPCGFVPHPKPPSAAYSPIWANANARPALR